MTENEAKTLLEQAEETTVMLKEISTDLKIIEKEIYMTKTELEQYRAIGTVEEFKALKEKNEPKKVIVVEYDEDEVQYRCSSCSSLVTGIHCVQCGQKLDWEED